MLKMILMLSYNKEAQLFNAVLPVNKTTKTKYENINYNQMIVTDVPILSASSNVIGTSSPKHLT